MSNLGRFDESQKDEADGVHNALGIFENIFELKPSICIDAARQGLFEWLLKRIKVCDFIIILKMKMKIILFTKGERPL